VNSGMAREDEFTTESGNDAESRVKQAESGGDSTAESLAQSPEASSAKDLADSSNPPVAVVTSRMMLKSLIKQNAASKGDGSNAKTASKSASTQKSSLEAEIVGQVLQDAYAVMDVTGRSENCIVYTAMDLSRDTIVALKSPKTLDETLKEKFKQAAFLHGKLKHPNILKTWAYLESEKGIPLLLMASV